MSHLRSLEIDQLVKKRVAGVEGLEPHPPVLEFGNSDDIVYYFVLISPKNQPLSSLGSRLDAVQFGPVLTKW